MAITQAVYNIGTAATTIVAPTNDSVDYVLKNLQPEDTTGAKARAGQIFALAEKFQVSGATNAEFSLVTGPHGMQFDYYRIVSENHNVTAELIENPTVSVTGSALRAFNLNRNYPDVYDAVFKAATSVSGGTVISREVVIASQSTGGEYSSNKVLTLKPNTQYAMRFDNTETGTTEMFLEIGFSEQYNGYNEIWLGTPDESFVIRPNESIQMALKPDATINAQTIAGTCQMAVIRQDS